MALEPRLMPFFMVPNVSRFLPSLKTLPNIPLSVCVLRFLCCRGPIVHVLLTFTFKGRFFQPILSYFATKDCPLGTVICLAAILLLNKILSLYILDTFTFPITTKYFFSWHRHLQHLIKVQQQQQEERIPQFAFSFIFFCHPYTKYQLLLTAVFSF